VQIYRHKLKTKHLESAALTFFPAQASNKIAAVFTHGHTSHKGAILSWAEKLYHAGIASTIFDLPGHYMGEGSDVIDLDLFSKEAPELFSQAINAMSEKLIVDHWIVGGHSLGALLSLKFLNLEAIPNSKVEAIAVGFAETSKSGNHLYQEAIFKKMLEFRSLLVSPALHHDYFFQWIRKEKMSLALKNKRLLLLSGRDDLVAKAEDVESLALRLKQDENIVELIMLDKLPHHEPEKAATHIRDYIIRKFTR
jgi:pimeloyl-ACP methyl ester carboxylesterase